MNLRHLTICASAFALVLGVGARRASADQWNQKTILTFNEPVQIPGYTLPAGTYVFQLAEPGNSRDVVQIWSQDKTHLYATVITAPALRDKATGKVQVTFREGLNGAPEAVNKWYYPGDISGHEFRYQRAQTSKIDT